MSDAGVALILGLSIGSNIILAWGWYAYHQRNRPPF